MISSIDLSLRPLGCSFLEFSPKIWRLIQKIKEYAIYIFSKIFHWFCRFCPCSFTAMSPAQLKAKEQEEYQQFQQRMQHLEGIGNVNLGNGNEKIGNCPELGVPQVPRIGRYGEKVGEEYQEDYNIAFPLMQVRLPGRQIKAFPPAIQAQFENIPLEKREVFFIICDDSNNFFPPPPADANGQNVRDQNGRNLCYHPLVSNQAKEYQNVPMGIFDPQGIQIHGERNPIAINNFSPANIIIHYEAGIIAMSPNNAQFRIDPSQPFSSFYSAALLPDRPAAAFVLLLRGDEQKRAIQGRWIQEFLQNLDHTPAFPDSLKVQIKNLFNFQWLYQ